MSGSIYYTGISIFWRFFQKLKVQSICKKQILSRLFVSYFLLHLSYIQVPWYGMPATPLRWFSILIYKGMFSQQSVTLVIITLLHCSFILETTTKWIHTKKYKNVVRATVVLAHIWKKLIFFNVAQTTKNISL